MTDLSIIEHILIVVDTLPEAFTVAMVRDALHMRGVIEADIRVRQYLNQLEACGVIEGNRPDGFHIVYRVVREQEAAL
jgi:hypothetical protein